MRVPIHETIQELLRYRRASFKATAAFRTLKHNEYLCPQLERQLDEVLNCFLKHRQIAYDVQGIHDRGTDVIFKFLDDDAESRYLGFQLKSFDDLNNREYLKELRA